MGCLNGEGGEKGRGLAILQLGEIERVFWRETEGKERKNVGKEERENGEFLSEKSQKTKDLELEELISWSTSAILAFQEVQHHQITSEG